MTRLERISRERDRPDPDEEAPRQQAREREQGSEQDSSRRHVDIRV